MDDIIKAFGIRGNPRSLSGGQNTSIIVGDFVLKPVDDNIESASWALGLLDQLEPKGYRVSKPKLSQNGTFVYNGWCCTRFEVGAHKPGHVKEKLAVAKAFHEDIKRLYYGEMPPCKNPWEMGHRIAWQREAMSNIISPLSRKVLHALLSKISSREYSQYQVIHSDLSGNILFDDALMPLVIDFSPTMGPIEYAETILVCDCIAWEGSPISDLEGFCHTKSLRDMIIRAVVFRLSVAAIFAGTDETQFLKEYENFKPILAYLPLM